ncbi:hypothetical protein JKP13_20500 [Vibrio vulnificus]|uniref:hypothetical protein n=1 Tax=Vibrio vulnificus TaxID=672 RepID=UPI001CDCB835|nr:hypothetical protein [Vibrio vulnificus]MCA3883113.1 hypothetical protein [Vibrio vulnificus]MCA3949447.1 hypothetical protein [Vibrio vulnificus]
MNLQEFAPTNGVSEVVQVMMLAVMDLYDKNPLIASIGYLSLTCSIPLKIVLNHFLAIKHEDNELVKARLKASIEARKVQAQQANLAGGNGE